jgi:hypothetical protein
MDGKVFHDGGWSSCRQSKRIDKVKPVCWFVFRHKHALLQKTFGLEHVSSQEKYSQWLGQRHETFACNGLYVFYWYMDRYVSFFFLVVLMTSTNSSYTDMCWASNKVMLLLLSAFTEINQYKKKKKIEL